VSAGAIIVWEILGTAALILLGNGVVANHVLRKNNGHNGGFLFITMGWAFAVFTEEIALWWKPIFKNRFRPTRKGKMRFEPGVGGRLVEEDPDSPGSIFEIGKIQVWEPGKVDAFSFAPWLAVLLLFVLAGVFAHGARMRADLEGTV